MLNPGIGAICSHIKDSRLNEKDKKIMRPPCFYNRDTYTDQMAYLFCCSSQEYDIKLCISGGDMFSH